MKRWILLSVLLFPWFWIGTGVWVAAEFVLHYFGVPHPHFMR